MRVLPKTILILVIAANTGGCGGMITRGDLPLVDSISKPEKPKSISYRLIFLAENSGRIYAYGEGTAAHQVETALINSNQFSQVKGIVPEFLHSKTPQRCATTDCWNKLLDKPVEVDTDLFLDVRYSGISLSSNVELLYIMIHGASLGFIPLWIDNDTDWNVRLLDRNGTLIDQSVIKDKSSVWYWTPLILFNGFHVLDIGQAMLRKAKENPMNNYLLKLKEQKSF